MGVNRAALALGTMAVAGALAGLAGVLLTFQPRRDRTGDR